MSEDGMVVIRGRLPQEIAAVLEKALEAAMDALKEEEKKEETDRERSEEACAPDDSAESWCRESFAQKRVDALGLLAQAALGKGLDQTERREPYQVMIHVDSAVLEVSPSSLITELRRPLESSHWH